MPRAVPGIVAFNAGELSPLLYGRTDLTKYQAGCRQMENFLPTSQGAATRRPGLEYIAATKGNAVARLIPFEFSTTQAYIIEATATTFRFYMNGGQIESSPGVAYEVSHPYGLADLDTIQYAQSADTLYLAHPNYAPRKLTRSGHTSWTLTSISFTATPAEWTGSNYPGTVAFFDERLFWGGTPNQPQTIWASKVNDFENLTTGSAADDALKFTLVDDQMNAVRWMSAHKVLLLGTAGGEFSVQASNLNEALTPSNLTARRQTTVGAKSVQAVRVGTAAIYVQRAGRKLQEIAYSYESDSYVSPELTLLAGHVTRAGIRSMAWHQEPWRVLWCVLDDGQLVGMTYMRDQQVVAWHRHPLGGTNAKALSVACIAGTNETQLWVVVERTINGSTKRYVEKMTSEFWASSPTDKTGAVFVDSAIDYNGSPATVLTGLDHLIGETVQVLADGATHPDCTVSAGGTITLDRAASVVQVGLACPALLETLDIEAGAQDGTAQTRRRRISEVGVRLFQTLGCKIGYIDQRGSEVLETVLFRNPTDPMDASPPLFSGDKVIAFPPRITREARVVVKQDAPLPITVTAIVPRVQTTE